MADLVQFELNQPVEIALKFPEPRLIETQFGGERAMYTTTDERVMFLDTLSAAKIKALGVQPGDCFYICKKKKGRSFEYDVFREADEPAPPPARRPILVGEAVAQAAQQPVESHPTGKKLPRAPDLSKVLDPRKFAGGNLEQQLEQSIALGHQPDGTFAVEAPRKPVAQARTIVPAWIAVLTEQTNALVDVYAATLEHASRHGIAVKPEDVRSLLVTSFIQLSQKGGRNAA